MAFSSHNDDKKPDGVVIAMILCRCQWISLWLVLRRTRCWALCYGLHRRQQGSSLVSCGWAAQPWCWISAVYLTSGIRPIILPRTMRLLCHWHRTALLWTCQRSEIFVFFYVMTSPMPSLAAGRPGRFEVTLDRYLLSHSTSSSWSMSYILSLFEENILPYWLSHYVLSIGNEDARWYFDLCRANKRLPFGSIAYFRVVNAHDEVQARDFDINRRMSSLHLGTTNMDPSDIVRTGTHLTDLYCLQLTSV